MNAAPICQRPLRHAVSRLPQQCHTATIRQASRAGRDGHRSYSTTPIPPAFTIAGVSAQEIESARAYCTNLVRTHDAPSYLLSTFIPPAAQTAHLALRALNIETARIADTTSTPTVGALRMQFWRDCITKSLSLTPPKEPVAILLASAAASLAAHTQGEKRLSRAWLTRLVTAREKRLSNPPFRDLADIETYAESTYSTLLYLTLSAVPLSSLTADHIASHIGKAQGIAAILRGLPFLAFPAPPTTHSPQNAIGGALPGTGRQGSVPLPLDIMAAHGVREEAVFRQGGAAPGLRDAVFAVATRANDHLITARDMVRNVQAGGDVGHEFEHGDDAEHAYEAEVATEAEGRQKPTQNEELNRAFGCLMPAISTQLWLDRLQAADFDVFDHSLRKAEWKLPWRAYWAFRGKKF